MMTWGHSTTAGTKQHWCRSTGLKQHPSEYSLTHTSRQVNCRGYARPGISWSMSDSILKRVKAAKGGKVPRVRTGSRDSELGISDLSEKIRGFEMGHDSFASLGESLGHLQYEREKEELLQHRSGTVPQIVMQFNEQIAANQEIKEKQARKQRYRNRKSHKPKFRPRKKKTQQHVLNESVWSNQMASPSFKVDPTSYEVPKKLTKPTGSQEKIIRQAMADNVLFRDNPGPQDALLHAFEPFEVRKGDKIEDYPDQYYYVVEEGQLDIQRNGQVVATAKAGDTFGDMNLVYKADLGRKNERSQTVVASSDARLLRLKQDDFRGIVQSQAKQDDLDKQEMLKKVPFMSKLLNARDSDTKKKRSSDAVDRITSVMKAVYFDAGDNLFNENDETLYIVKKGNVKLTSTKNQQFVLGPGDYIGRKALMGTRGKEPEVKAMEALSSGVAYAIEKSVAEKVLGLNYVNRQTSRLDDTEKLDNFRCIKSVKLDRATLETLAETVDDKTFDGGSNIMTQGAQVEPCLYLVREGTVVLSSDDGSFVREVGPGGYFGVEKLLVPKDAPGDKSKPSKDLTLPAQWNVTVAGDTPCVMGVLSLVDSQEILDNDGKKKEKPLVEKPESQFVVKRKQTSKIVRSKVEFDDLDMISVLGDGAFGEVWLVETDITGKKEQFALKKIDKQEEMIDALNREVAFLTRFGFHPFIVNLVKVFDRDDSMYMLMNLATGGELWDVVHREDDNGNWTSGIPEIQARFYAFLLADVLGYIHSKQFVYRDLKPENVLIDSDGYPILIDFGFAKHCPEKTVRNLGVAFHAPLGILPYSLCCLFCDSTLAVEPQIMWRLRLSQMMGTTKLWIGGLLEFFCMKWCPESIPSSWTAWTKWPYLSVLLWKTMLPSMLKSVTV